MYPSFVPAELTRERLQFAKSSICVSFMDDIINSSIGSEMYNNIVRGISRNVKYKEGGFESTTGLHLTYYLSLPTSFMDKDLAPNLVKLYTMALRRLIDSLVESPDEQIVIIGIEVAGGMLVSQLAALGDPVLVERCHFIYMRKERKSTGTCQQLEAKAELTARTSTSPPLKAIWVDDVMSTGRSLCEGIYVLKEDYNIEVKSALYVVDRSKDRKNLDNKPQIAYLANDMFFNKQVTLNAVMDVEIIDKCIEEMHENNQNK